MWQRPLTAQVSMDFETMHELANKCLLLSGIIGVLEGMAAADGIQK